jgi:hypothetical protein
MESSDRSTEPRQTAVQAPPNYSFPDDGPLPWSFAESRLIAARNYWLSTSRPDGRPHVTPVWGVWVDGAVYFDGPPVTRWSRNLHTNPAISMHLESAEEVVILEGQAEDLTTDAETGARIVDAWTSKYGRLMPDPAGDGILRLRPRVARGWSTSALTDGTRWEFDPTS